MLRGVDRVELAVEELHAHALDRVAGDHAGCHRLLDALLDGGDETTGDHAALDRVHELEALAALDRLDLDVAVGELAAAARLLLVAGARPRPAPRSVHGVGRAPRLLSPPPVLALHAPPDHLCPWLRW